ncbi:SufS family cysteine desulfurase [Candidatus Actinomarina]|jgi:cysteine desulfurase/selenocysteine lyase|nr:SufS family cysteine desulfurase [Candidatus Actinomarina sp.]|tara:strand:- start:542 stop:1765 length:1224 start_codon:yes stop_codon:yes gene_type:complete
MKEFQNIKDDFPIFEREINSKRLTYLDSGATSQKPKTVIEAMSNVYLNTNANVHRGTYVLSAETTQLYEGVRNKCKKFLNAYHSDEIIFTKGATEGFNFLANSISKKFLQPGDEILLTEIEHHANIIPWQMVAEEHQLEIKYISVNENFSIDLDELKQKISKKTKVVSITGESNLSGLLPDIKLIRSIIKENSDALFIVDGAQLVPHRKVDVQDLGIDFIVFSGHKLLGPTGIGVVWGRLDLLNELEPVSGGGDMIEEVYYDRATWAPVPHKFEAGTPPYVEAIGLGAAIDYLENITMEKVSQHSDNLRKYAQDIFSDLDRVNVIHTNEEFAGCTFSMHVDQIHATDISLMLDTYGVAVRAGHHCVQPYHRKLGIDATFRATGYIYNDENDLDVFKDALLSSIAMLG